MPDAKEDEVATPTTPAPDSDKPAEPAADAPQPKPKRKRKWDDAGDAAAAAPADQNGAEEKKDEGEKKDDAERDGSGTPTTDAAKDLAAEAAAKINKLLEAKGLVAPAAPTVPGLGIPLSLPDLPPAKRSKEAAFTAEVEINDVKSRYTLTKGETLKMITAETGADVSTRGRYFADKSLATPSDPALHLHVTAHTQEALDKGLARINELIEAAGGVDPTPAPAPQPVAPRPPPISFRDNDPWPEDKVYVTGFDPGFTVRAKIVGPGGQYVKHIQGETGTKVQVKGRGSNYIETSTGREADDDMHVYITGPSLVAVMRAKALVEDLLTTVREEHAKWKAERARPPQRPPAPGYGGYPQYGAPAGYPGYPAPGMPAAPGYPAPPSGTLPAGSPTTPGSAAGQADPYAAYYSDPAAYQAYMQYYYQQYYQQAGYQMPGAEAGYQMPGAGAGYPGMDPSQQQQPPPPPPADPQSNREGTPDYSAMPPPSNYRR